MLEEQSRFPSWSENALREQTQRNDTSFGVLLQWGKGVSVLIWRPGPEWVEFPAGITEGEPWLPYLTQMWGRRNWSYRHLSFQQSCSKWSQTIMHSNDIVALE